MQTEWAAAAVRGFDFLEKHESLAIPFVYILFLASLAGICFAHLSTSYWSLCLLVCVFTGLWGVYIPLHGWSEGRRIRERLRCLTEGEKAALAEIVAHKKTNITTYPQDPSVSGLLADGILEFRADSFNASAGVRVFGLTKPATRQLRRAHPLTNS